LKLQSIMSGIVETHGAYSSSARLSWQPISELFWASPATRHRWTRPR